MITIGIAGSRGKSDTAEIIDMILKENGFTVCIIGTKKDSKVEFLKLAYEKIDYCIIEISREDLLVGNLKKIRFDILIQTALDSEDDEIISSIQELISNIKDNGYIIFNSDSIQKINFECSGIYPVTYGLNGKTAVTASSIDDIDGLGFSYCLQRSIVTINGNLVQPFEKPLKTTGKALDVCYHLAACTCAVILDLKI